MQKHERLAFEAARKELEPTGASLEFGYVGRQAHARITVHWPNGRSIHFGLASSPKDRDNCINNTRQWARRAARGAQA